MTREKHELKISSISIWFSLYSDFLLAPFISAEFLRAACSQRHVCFCAGTSFFFFGLHVDVYRLVLKLTLRNVSNHFFVVVVVA